MTNRKELSNEEIKKVTLNLLVEVDKFCRDNEISYSLAYGSLLGAIRHNGYIPWDDDIDLMMTRSNYRKFIDAWSSVGGNFGLCSPELDWSYYAPYANVYDLNTILLEEGNSHLSKEIGVKIDIFPVDVVPDDEQEYLQLRKKSTLINKIMGHKRWPLNAYFKTKNYVRLFSVLIEKGLLLLVPYSYINRKLSKMCQKYVDRYNQYCDIVCFNPYKNTRFRYKVFDTYNYHKFESYEFQIVEDYDEVLSSIYGDYMTPPPVDKRVSWHTFKAYRKDK